MTTALCEVPIGRVEDELVALAGQLSAGTCRWLVLLGEFDRRGGWEGWGINSCVHWLSIRLAISPTTARAQLRVAHTLAGLPVVTEQFSAGRLSYSQVRALCRVADAGNEAELVRLAQEMNADQLERMCRLLRGLDDAADAEAAVRTSMVTRWDDDGSPPSGCGSRTRTPPPSSPPSRNGRRRSTCGRPPEETHHVLHWVDGHRTAVDLLTSLCGPHHRAHQEGRCTIDINPEDGQVRFTRPDGGPILTPAVTTGTARDFQAAFPVTPGTVPSRWDGSPLLAAELTPPLKEHAEPTTLRFGSHRTPEKTATRLARTLGGRFEQEGDLWVTSTPELITITPEPAGGSLVTIELTTRPHHLTTTLTAIRLNLVPGTPDNVARQGHGTT